MARFSSVSVSVDAHVGSLQLNRPRKSNAVDSAMWEEIPRALQELVAQGARAVSPPRPPPSARRAQLGWRPDQTAPHLLQIVLSGAGKNFCAGIDLDSLMQSQQSAGGDEAAACGGRHRWRFRQFVRVLQDAMSAFEACPVPVIAAVHGHCIGAGVDMITACDIRLATEAANFSVKVRHGFAGRGRQPLNALPAPPFSLHLPLPHILPACTLPGCPIPLLCTGGGPRYRRRHGHPAAPAEHRGARVCGGAGADGQELHRRVGRAGSVGRHAASLAAPPCGLWFGLLLPRLPPGAALTALHRPPATPTKQAPRPRACSW